MQPTFLDAPTRRTLIIHYVVAVSMFWTALYLHVPTLPTYVESKSETLALVGVVLAQYGLWQTIARLQLCRQRSWPTAGTTGCARNSTTML